MTLRNTNGQPFSKWKPAEKFAWQWNETGTDYPPETELEFCPDRKWRFDFAWEIPKVAVEIDGFGYGHQAQQNMAADNEKQNVATCLGWKVLRFNSRQLGSKAGVEAAVLQVSELICGVNKNKENQC